MDLYNLVVSAKLSKGGGGGGDIDVDALTVTENGKYTASSGHAYSPVTVNVPQPSGTKDITTNGTHDVAAYASANVNVPSVTPTGNINITSTAQTDVSAYATAQVVDADLVAGNIKKDVNILGVTGTYEGGGGGGGDDTLKKLIEGSLVNWVVPNGISAINNNVASYCASLESVTVPEGVTSIGNTAFYGDTSLRTVDLPSTITSIGNNVFALGAGSYSSHGLSITLRATTPPTLGSNFSTRSKSTTIYVPAASVDTYKAASGWSSYAAKIQAISE